MFGGRRQSDGDVERWSAVDPPGLSPARHPTASARAPAVTPGCHSVRVPNLFGIVSSQRPLPDPPTAAVKTYRYLRLAMILLVVGLFACVLYEHAKARNGCWQTSISAYYYTPVQGFLVAALVTIGVSLVALRGNTDWEDALLNLAGVCAPVVAFVPYPRPGTCGSVLTDTRNRLVNIDNNMLGLIVAGGLALVVVGVLTHLSERSGGPDRPGPVGLLGFWAIAVLFLAATAVYFWDRSLLLDHGHDVAAVAMFGFIFLNVWLNAAALHRNHNATATRSIWRNRYTVVGVLMAVAVVANVAAHFAGFRWWVLTLETSMIVLFAWFWIAQTIELWNQGLRGRAALRPQVTEG
jgi:hypothetical protein